MQVDAASGEKIKRQGVFLSKVWTITMRKIFKRQTTEMYMIKGKG